MKAKGFTLIELLAVIVILAIIALIATPIILNIISNSKEESNKRSIDMYAKAVENAVAQYQLNEGKSISGEFETTDGKTLSPKTTGDSLTVDYDGSKVVCGTINVSIEGKIYLANCSVNGTSVDGYVYGNLEETGPICTAVTTATEDSYTAGDKYECKVDPNKDPYTFYVLTSAPPGSTSVNLIMDSNINKSGEAVKEGVSDLGETPWLSQTDSSKSTEEWDMNLGLASDGPITAMNYLQTATSSWTNLEENKVTVSKYTDEYGAQNGMKTYNVYARMPYYSEVSASNGTNEYLYENLDGSSWNGSGIQPTNNVSDVKGYWTLSYQTSGDQSHAWVVWYEGDWNGGLYEHYVDDTYYKIGVRPVITISTSDLG